MNKAEIKTMSQVELRDALDTRKRVMQEHLHGLQSELTLADVNVGGMPVLDHVRERPLVAVAAVAGGVVLLRVLIALARRDGPEEDRQALWTRAQLDDLVEAAAYRVQRGEDADEALRRALRSRAPVIVVEEGPMEATRSAVGSTVRLVLNSALGFGLKYALDVFAQRVTGEPEIIEAATDA